MVPHLPCHVGQRPWAPLTVGGPFPLLLQDDASGAFTCVVETSAPSSEQSIGRRGPVLVGAKKEGQSPDDGDLMETHPSLPS